MPIIYLTSIFFFIALLYSSIGFGGGSSYIAIMLLANVPFEKIPIIALICNLIVVSGGAFHYIKNKHVDWKFLLPFILTSIPMAYLGGRLPIEKEILKIVLGICLLCAGARMLFFKKRIYNDLKMPSQFISLLLGSFLGLLSGIVGIGGGIFLSPILYNLRWGRPQQISSLCCLFIFFNSISGLMGQMSKVQSIGFISSYWSLALAVLFGGQIGSFIGVKKLGPRTLEVLTAILVLFVSLRILFF